MNEIRIGEKGYIEAGEDQSSYVVVQDDRARTGGYLIFLSKSSEFDSEVFDQWAESIELLSKMLTGSHIRWLGIPLFLHPGHNRPVPVCEVVPKPRIGVKGVEEIWVRRGLSKPRQRERRYLLVQQHPSIARQYTVYISASPDFIGEVRSDCVQGEEALHRYLAGAIPESFVWTDEPFIIKSHS